MSGVGGPNQLPEQVSLGEEVELADEPMTMGGNRLENYSVSGFLWVEKAGADETVIREARDRAFDIFAAIETYLNDTPTVGSTVLDADLEANSCKNMMSPEGRVCVIEFTVRVRAAKNP